MNLHGAVPQMTDHFSKHLPKRLAEALPRWLAVATHPDVADEIHTLRDDSVSYADRHDAMQRLAAAVEEATGSRPRNGPTWTTSEVYGPSRRRGS